MANEDQDRLAQLRADVERLRGEAREIAEGRQAMDMSSDDISRLEEIESEVSHLQDQIVARERIERLQAQQDEPGPTRRTQSAPTSRAMAATRHNPTAGFSSMGEFAQCVQRASQPSSQGIDPRLAQMAPTTYSAEQVGSDGGYLVPPEFSTRVMEYVGDQGSLYSRVDKVPVNHELSWPVDEDAPWSTSGPQAYWEGEADQYTQSKLHVRSSAMKLNKLVALCPVSDELLQDAPQLNAYLTSVIGKKLRYKIDNAIIRGTGAGMPLGILNAPCLKSTTRTTGSHIESGDVFLVYSGLYGDFRSNAIWIYNQDVEPDLWVMVVAGASSDVPVFLPAGSPYSNLANSPSGTLMGRPIVPHQACSTLGTVGDLICCDPMQYILGYKTLGPVMASSIHLFFDYGMQAVRATHRICGMPKWSTTIAAANGSATYSAFVTVAT